MRHVALRHVIFAARFAIDVTLCLLLFLLMARRYYAIAARKSFFFFFFSLILPPALMLMLPPSLMLRRYAATRHVMLYDIVRRRSRLPHAVVIPATRCSCQRAAMLLP